MSTRTLSGAPAQMAHAACGDPKPNAPRSRTRARASATIATLANGLWAPLRWGGGAVHVTLQGLTLPAQPAGIAMRHSWRSAAPWRTTRSTPLPLAMRWPVEARRPPLGRGSVNKRSVEPTALGPGMRELLKRLPAAETWTEAARSPLGCTQG